MVNVLTGTQPELRDAGAGEVRLKILQCSSPHHQYDFKLGSSSMAEAELQRGSSGTKS